MSERTAAELIEAYAAQDAFRSLFPGVKPKIDNRIPADVSAGIKQGENTA